MRRVGKEQRRELEGLFVHWTTGPDGRRRRFVGGKVTTNDTRTTRQRLWQIERLGLATVEDNRQFGQVFGVKAWDVELTEAGRELLTQTTDEARVGKEPG